MISGPEKPGFLESSSTSLTFLGSQEKSSKPGETECLPSLYPSLSSQTGWNLLNLILLGDQFSMHTDKCGSEATWSPWLLWQKEKEPLSQSFPADRQTDRQTDRYTHTTAWVTSTVLRESKNSSRRLGSQDKGAGRFAVCSEPSSWFSDGHLLIMSSHGLSPFLDAYTRWKERAHFWSSVSKGSNPIMRALPS